MKIFRKLTSAVLVTLLSVTLLPACCFASAEAASEEPRDIAAGSPAAQASDLPDGWSQGIYLDIWDDDGFNRSSTECTVSRTNLAEDEYYSPALVVRNNSSEEFSGSFSYCLDGTVGSFGTCSVPTDDALSLRPTLPQLKGAAGTHEISWYYNDMFIASFVWTAE